jgi:hypothetical protein
MKTKIEIGVCYLARVADGVDPLIRFLESYEKFNSGIEHDLIIGFKAGILPSENDRAKEIFSKIKHIAIALPDKGYDIGAYFEMAKIVNYKYLLFLNTFSEIKIEFWLKIYIDALVEKKSEFLGTTASWQSSYSGKYCNLHKKIKSIPDILVWLKTLWAYPIFPSPHVRTNAFIVRRDLFLNLKRNDFKKKEDTYLFENGRNSMTNQLKSLGFEVAVVGSDSVVYQIPDWEESKTFWTGNQNNLIVSDNQTRDYELGTEKHKNYLNSCGWHDPRVVSGYRVNYLISNFSIGNFFVDLVSEIYCFVKIFFKFLLRYFYEK